MGGSLPQSYLLCQALATVEGRAEEGEQTTFHIHCRRDQQSEA